MKNIILIFILFIQVVPAQNKRFVYQYTFIPDSTNKTNVVKELMILDVTNDRSMFFSQRKYISDSTIIAPSNKGKLIMPPADLNILYRIEKKDGKTYFESMANFALMKIKVEDDRKMDWKILGDKQKILNFNTQRASLDFAGREWIAWFTPDIPFQDGPYKFHGLPGLIVKIEDITKSHAYELIGIINLPNEYSYPERYQKVKEREFNLMEFKKYYLQGRSDPGAGERQLYMEGKIPDQRDSSGNFRTGAEIVREVEQLAKERIKKDNNIIEIDLIKEK